MEASSAEKFRSHRVQALLELEPGTDVLLAGWVQRKRALGTVLFIELRDASGVVQCVFDKGTAAFDAASEIRPESVVQVRGVLVQRSAGNENPKLSTGRIEVRAAGIELLGAAGALPFSVTAERDPPEELRLRHRFLDLRRERLRQNVLLRARVIARLRELLHERGFIELQTPILTSSSPEGARDFLVPSRLHPGKFYALPQAPQVFKQLYMVAGFERYFQIAPCFRDEDARADRSPGEFYQLDIELAFASQAEIFETIEPVLADVFTRFGAWPVSTLPFPRISYRDAALRFASDKPDLRNPLQFAAVSVGPWTRVLRVPGGCGLGSSAWARLLAPLRDAGLAASALLLEQPTRGALAKAPREVVTELLAASRAEPGDALVATGGRPDRPSRELSALRLALGHELGLSEKESFRFCWVVDFPMYERNPRTGAIEFSHNPFSMPQGGLQALDGEPEQVLAHQYDIVCNGVELSSGALRNHRPEIMLRAFAIAGYGPEEVERRFGALLEAFRCGAPPHGGLAPGIDRMVMLLANETNLREVIAFPLTQNGQDLLLKAPSAVSDAQLGDLHLTLLE